MWIFGRAWYSSPKYLLRQSACSTRKKNLNVVYQQIWGRPTAPTKAVGPFFVLTMLVTRMFAFSSRSLCCSPDVLNEQEEEGLVSQGLLAVCWSIPYSVSTVHRSESEREKSAFGLTGNVLSHVQQTSARWLISGSVQQRLHSHPAVTSSLALRTKVAGKHWVQCVFSRIDLVNWYCQTARQAWHKGPGLNLTGCQLLWPSPTRAGEEEWET